MNTQELIPAFGKVLAAFGKYSRSLTGDGDAPIDDTCLAQYNQATRCFARCFEWFSSSQRTYRLLSEMYRLDMSLEEIEEHQIYNEDANTDLVGRLADWPSLDNFTSEAVQGMVVAGINEQRGVSEERGQTLKSEDDILNS